MTARTTVCLLLVLTLAALPMKGGPRMYWSQKTGNITFGDCADRAAKALESQGFSVRAEHRVWFGEGPAYSVVVICYELSATHGIVTVTAAGPSDQGAAAVVDRLERAIWVVPSTTGLCGNLAGEWKGNFRGGGATLIEQNGATLFLTNEMGQRVAGTCNGGVIHAPEWNNLFGDIRDNGSTIAWRNGTTWTRIAKNGLPPQVTFLGTWRRGAGSPRIEGTEPEFTCFNEHGASSRCVVLERNRIKAIDWEGGLIGWLSDDGKRIDWANGTFWTR
jgi:hypothetical protein